MKRIYRIVGISCFIWLSAAGGMLLSACAKRGQPLQELATPKDDKASYLARRGDSLMVEVWGEQRLTGERLVRDDGKLTMPLINDITAEGKSLEAISHDIAAKLAAYIPSASVSVSVAHSAPIRYYLSGLFNKNGEYRSDTKITLLQAIAAGGGFAPFADRGSIVLIRKSAQAERRYVLDYGRVVDGKDPNPELKDGDLISVE